MTTCVGAARHGSAHASRSHNVDALRSPRLGASVLLVPSVGFEPTRLSATNFEFAASASSATRALLCCLLPFPTVHGQGRSGGTRTRSRLPWGITPTCQDRSNARHTVNRHRTHVLHPQNTDPNQCHRFYPSPLSFNGRSPFRARTCSTHVFALVPPVGLEPTRLSTRNFEFPASTSSATGALRCFPFHRFEPSHRKGLEPLCLLSRRFLGTHVYHFHHRRCCPS